jgi:O-methyltransferase
MFDSYEGLPDPGPSDGTRAQGFRTLPAAETFDNCTASLADVEAGARTLGVRHLVRPVKGWFADTLPLHRDQIGPIALLRLDGDWYESTKTCLDTLASAVVPGGLIVVDDYYDWEGCRVAVHEWIAARRFSAAITLCWPRHQWPGTPCVAIRIPGA